MKKTLFTAALSMVAALTIPSCGNGSDGPVDAYNAKYLFGCTTGGVVRFYNQSQLVASYRYSTATIPYNGNTSYCEAMPTTLQADGTYLESVHKVTVTELITRDKHDFTIVQSDTNNNVDQTQFSVTYTGSPANRGPFAPDTITGTLPGNVTFTHIESIPNR